MALLQAVAKAKQLQLSLETSLPDSLRLLFDAPRYAQIIRNLVGNAVKFTGAGRVTVRVFRDDGSGEKICLEVEDTGPGIPPDKLHSIFDEFSQISPSDSRSHGGTGLGLTMTRRLVKLMGGTLTVEQSRPAQT